MFILDQGEQGLMRGASAQLAFGIDLGGYAAGKSVCAMADDKGDHVKITILSGCPFSLKCTGADALGPVVADEIQFLRKLIQRAPVAVDAPIDVSSLESRKGRKLIWELTLRPIDKRLKALPPLADRIGAITARLRNILVTGGLYDKVGNQLFETYPAGSLAFVGVSHRGYKGRREEATQTRRRLARSLKFYRAVLTDDELDASICAISALPRYRLEKTALANQLKLDESELPKGYILLKQLPPKVTVQHAPSESAIQ